MCVCVCVPVHVVYLCVCMRVLVCLCVSQGSAACPSSLKFVIEPRDNHNKQKKVTHTAFVHHSVASLVSTASTARVVTKPLLRWYAMPCMPWF
jgi:hypothetical protein